MSAIFPGLARAAARLRPTGRDSIPWETDFRQPWAGRERHPARSGFLRSWLRVRPMSGLTELRPCAKAKASGFQPDPAVGKVAAGDRDSRNLTQNA